ncbi:Imm53 family immunity protein [Streptomyces sp. NPDC057621]
MNRSPQDWVCAWTAEPTFHAACGPANLTEVLTLFRTWVTTSTP